MKSFVSKILVFCFLTCNISYAKNSLKVDIEELVLPTEVESLPKKSGSIYYSKAVKNKVLVPTNFWGEVENSGLHFIPQGTSLIKGLSLAGGPTGDANIADIQVTQSADKELKTIKFDLTRNDNLDAHRYTLQAGDVVFVKKERYYEDRTYYTSLISVAATLLSGILLYREVRESN